MEPDFHIFIFQTQINVFLGPVTRGHVREFTELFIKSENVGQTISDPGQKLIVYTLPSIWQYPFFQNDIKIPVFCQNRHPQKIGFFLYCIAYWYCLLAPVIAY